MNSFEPILIRMNDMTGKRFLYRDKKVTFESYELRGEIVIFLFKNGSGSFSIEKDKSRTDLFLESLKEIPDEVLTEVIQEVEKKSINSNFPERIHYEPVILRENRKLLTDLKDMLLSDMVKVRADKTYIPQAKQACNTANSIINLAKLEIMMLRTD